MKLLVFAHTPPPFHGQSYMVKLMIDGLRSMSASETGIEVIHVNARVSDTSGEIGAAKVEKIIRLIRYSFAAIRYRFTEDVTALYYVPAPGKRAALYRDWIAMLLCRPFYNRVILHWHAVGLGEWLKESAYPWERWLTLKVLGRARLSIVLSRHNAADASRLRPRSITIVPNGIPDPCPEFETTLLPVRLARYRARCRPDEAADAAFTVLFFSACTAAKGLFATLDAVALLNARLTNDAGGLRLRLIVAGEFSSSKEKKEFDSRRASDGLLEFVQYRGFVAEGQKAAMFAASDCLCFPSLYPHEGQPVSLIEALAFGLPIVATAWRGIPELLAGTGAYLVPSQAPEGLADALDSVVRQQPGVLGRRRFLERHSLTAYIRGLTDAIQHVV